MRKSLEDLNAKYVRKIDNYPGLPEELREYCYRLSDAGYVIMAIPEKLLKEHFCEMDLWRYEVGIPVKYVLEKGYRFFEGYVSVDAPYDGELGLDAGDEYYEF